jgi:predicted nucleic acid-binding protein
MMVLVDTSVWVDYLREGDVSLARLLAQGRVCQHPMIIGELLCGHLQNRGALHKLWKNLPQVVQASHSEVIHLLENQHLMGRGIGYVDLHLVAACILSDAVHLWTHDKRLASVADSLGIAYSTE